MIAIGLTGNLGAGKTTIAGMFKKLGAKVLNADQMAHELIEPKGACFKDVVSSFGKDILTKGKIDRKKLAQIVFNDPKKLECLNKIIHPKVIQQISGEILRSRKLKGHTVPIIVEAALLIESGLHQFVDEIIVVKANHRLQLERILQPRGISKEEALVRLKMQMGVQEKIRYADVVIDNRRSLNQTQKQVEDIWQRIMQRNRTN